MKNKWEVVEQQIIKKFHNLSFLNFFSSSKKNDYLIFWGNASNHLIRPIMKFGMEDLVLYSFRTVLFHSNFKITFKFLDEVKTLILLSYRNPEFALINWTLCRQLFALWLAPLLPNLVQIVGSVLTPFMWLHDDRPLKLLCTDELTLASSVLPNPTRNWNRTGDKELLGNSHSWPLQRIQ